MYSIYSYMFLFFIIFLVFDNIFILIIFYCIYFNIMDINKVKCLMLLKYRFEYIFVIFLEVYEKL